jgi:hypothetical protein
LERNLSGILIINEALPVPKNETYALMLAGLAMLGFVT